jgi:environmental stress-induced protein Ves
MSSPTILNKLGYKRSVWKNGLGHTDEIAIFPPTASLAKGDFLWRLSSARIERASPFSVFPDHDRVLLVLKGAGLRLTHTFVEGEPEEKVDLPRLEPYEFPGDVPSRCDLIDGPITDFSVFVRKAEVEPMVQVVSVDEGEAFSWMPEGRWNFAFAAEGNFNVEEGQLNEGDAYALAFNESGTEPREIFIRAETSGAKLLLISLL